MNNIVRAIAFCGVFWLLSGCNEATGPAVDSADSAASQTAVPSMLTDISGVWRASDGTMISIVYEEKKLRLVFNMDVIPVQVGAVDDQNHTANLKVTLPNGKPGIWTISQIFDSEKEAAFTLQLTLHDGTQDQLSFVRKISTDDLNVIAAAESKVHAGSVSGAIAQPQEPQPTNEMKFNEDAAIPAAMTAEESAWAPSFDCAKASTGPERLICSSRELSAADVALAQAYRAARRASNDKAWLTGQQATWRKTVRDACSDVQCMLEAHEQRMSELH